MIALVRSEDPAVAPTEPAPVAAADPAPVSVLRKCYVCNSIDDASCAGENGKFAANDKHKKDCTNGESFCRIITQNIDGEKSIIRQCAKELYKPNYVGCYKTAGKSTQNVCTCNSGDYCNSASVFKSSMLAIALSAIVASLFI